MALRQTPVTSAIEIRIPSGARSSPGPRPMPHREDTTRGIEARSRSTLWSLPMLLSEKSLHPGEASSCRGPARRSSRVAMPSSRCKRPQLLRCRGPGPLPISASPRRQSGHCSCF
ncbi:MAG: hypothetical protein MZV70_37160 [Desulfobacterales bacterium]|nr:hypothetical protein [Desulfobacterales bacterium]